MIVIALTNVSLPAKKRILQACVQLFLEKGYKKTTMVEILTRAEVSNSSFQNIFKSKDGVLSELLEFMFSSQFGAARKAALKLPPVYVYAVETAIQLTLTELNENLREIYVLCYSQPNLVEYIYWHTTRELYNIFGPYQPELSIEDFFILEVGSAGMMRSYMAKPCSDEMSLQRKLRSFLTLSLRGYKVPEKEVMQIVGYIERMNIRAISEQIMQGLFQELTMHFTFSLSETAKQPVKNSHSSKAE